MCKFFCGRLAGSGTGPGDEDLFGGQQASSGEFFKFPLLNSVARSTKYPFAGCFGSVKGLRLYSFGASRTWHVVTAGLVPGATAVSVLSVLRPLWVLAGRAFTFSIYNAFF